MYRRQFVLHEVPPPSPKSRPVFRPAELPAFKGQDDCDMLCGQCGRILIESIAPENWLLASYDGRPVVVRCICGAFNEIPLVIATELEEPQQSI